jgi:hypothetical protein
VAEKAGNRRVKTNTTYRLRFKCIDRPDMRLHIIRNRLEALQHTLSLVHHCLVLQHVAVVGDVDGRGLRGERRMDTLRFGMALAESLEGRYRF